MLLPRQQQRPDVKIYPARYKDRFGEEQTTISNDGVSLTMVVRGVRFRGNDFDSFEPEGVSAPAELTSFTLHHGSLCACVIEADILLPVVTPSGVVDGLLTFELELGAPLPNGRIDGERLTLRLVVDGRTYCSKGKSGWFEDELLEVQRALPPDTFMQACINCTFSDYSPAGHGLFGGMICFRHNKTGYLELPSGKSFNKGAYFAVLSTVSEQVQETHLCPEFERRKPGTGYRG